MIDSYYIYIYLDPRKKGTYNYKNYSFCYEPFYVGMGKLKYRLYEHLKDNNLKIDKNKLKTNKIKSIRKQLNRNPIIVKLYSNLTKKKSCEIEKSLIKEIGRINLETGPLCNLTDGGDGTYGYKPSKNALKNWKKSIKKFYSIKENRDKFAYFNTEEYYVERYGNILGPVKFQQWKDKIKKSIDKVYEDINLRKRCANKGIKNGMYGVASPNAKRVKIKGIIYNSIFKASKETKIPYTTLSQRLKNNNFPDYELL